MKRAIVGLAIAGGALAAAAWPPAHPVDSSTAPWQWIAPQEWRQVGRLAHPRLAEASGVASSVANPGRYWTINDSGNRPELLAIDSTGTLLATIPITNAPNVDWEEVALGPCGEATCVYIADTGDNAERRREVAIHRVVEPTLAAGGAEPAPLRVETLRFRYAGGAHDVEAMGVLPDGAILLVTKGRRGGILAYRLEAEDWRSSDPVVAERVDSLPIAAALGSGRVVTGMAITTDGTRAMVRTYRDLFPFAIKAGRTFQPLGAPTACDILGHEPQGEAIAWIDESRLILLSERGLFKEGTVFLAECRP